MSEIVDSGHSADKSNFSHTFNLLSQYLKENGTFGDLTLGGAGTGMASGSMDLFQKPPVAQAQMQDEDEEIPKEQKQRAQMTIFYGGQVMVVQNFPADKAMEVMKLASADGKSGTQTTCFHYPVSDSASDWITKSENLLQIAARKINIDKQGGVVRLQHSLVSDLPIARKASLARFLEKRKERLLGKAPYKSQDNHGTGTGTHSKQVWLGLAATESGGQFQPQS